MVKKVRRYILFLIIGLFSSFLEKAEADAFIIKCNNGQSAKACCKSAHENLEPLGGGAQWNESKGYCYVNVHYF